MKDKLTQFYTELHRRHDFSVLEMVQTALSYYEDDRERYIALYDANIPRHLHRSGEGGVWGKCIPIAQKVETTQVPGEEVHLQEHFSILQLLVTERGTQPVCCRYTVTQTLDRSEIISATYHAYYPITLADIDSTYRILPPEQIRPAATRLEKDIFAACVGAFQAIRNYENPNPAYHKAECAMQQLAFVAAKQISLNGELCCGKLVELATEADLCTEYHQDHNHSYKSDLILFVMEDAFHLLLRTTHTYQYFLRTIEDETAPGGCFYKYGEEKREEVYTCADLHDLPPDMLPHYY